MDQHLARQSQRPWHLNILGTRGIPAAHGGFETFAAKLAQYLLDRGWSVTVYCQDDRGTRSDGETDRWQGIERVFFRTSRGGSFGTVEFDFKCVRHCMGQPGIDLVLGYNTALFNLPQRLVGRRILMNMDGIEWRRAKWGRVAKAWLFLNEVIGSNLAHVTIADHPRIAEHIARRCLKPPVMIPYGADRVETADAAPLRGLGLAPGRYAISIARIEPENSILELVQGARALPDGFRCVVLGNLDPANPYHARVKSAGGNQVIFPGAIYDTDVVAALRYHALVYLHGHQVGGTNPSLVEALGAGNAVLAHDNPFNRWTAGPGQFYFADPDECAHQIRMICRDPARLTRARQAARKRFAEAFEWTEILSRYEDALVSQCGQEWLHAQPQ